MQKSDLELWEAFRQGDAEAFSEIYKRYIGELLTYGNRVSNDHQLVKDSIHSLFLHIWEHRVNLSPTDSIKFYLFRSLRNRIIEWKRRASEPLLPGDMEEYMGEHSLERSIEQVSIENEIYDEQISSIRKGIESLSTRQQEIIQLRYFHNLNSEEIARLLKINNQSARNLLHRSISQLRTYLADLPNTWISSLVIFVFC